eukprot:2648813-Rhodomonas_salina.2
MRLWSQLFFVSSRPASPSLDNQAVYNVGRSCHSWAKSRWVTVTSVEKPKTGSTVRNGPCDFSLPLDRKRDHPFVCMGEKEKMQ